MTTRWLATLLLVEVALAQMTFSDGWEKRSISLTTKKPRMDMCNIEYSQGLIELHQQMVDLYNKFTRCQRKDGKLLTPLPPKFF